MNYITCLHFWDLLKKKNLNKHTLFKKLDKNQQNAKYRSNTSIAVCV